MAKHGSGMTSHGMSPRKAMASGMTDSGAGGVPSYEEHHGGMGPHPDHTMGTGERGAMPDHERAIGEPVHHTKGHHPAQAAPDHGPHHVNGYGDHSRDGKA